MLIGQERMVDGSHWERVHLLPAWMYYKPLRTSYIRSTNAKPEWRQQSQEGDWLLLTVNQI